MPLVPFKRVPFGAFQMFNLCDRYAPEYAAALKSNPSMREKRAAAAAAAAAAGSFNSVAPGAQGGGGRFHSFWDGAGYGLVRPMSLKGVRFPNSSS